MTRVSPLADFLLPDGFARPGVRAVLREGSVVTEAGRFAWSAVGDRRRQRSTPYVARSAPRDVDPVVLVPGFLAGDRSLTVMSGALRRAGLRTYRSGTHANIGCNRTAAEALEARIEEVAHRRDSRVQVVGHSLGGMLARGVAARRPDLVSRVVTMGSPMLAPAAHHLVLSISVQLLVRLNLAGLRSLMSSDCVGGDCARSCFDDTQAPLPDAVDLTCLYSRRDGIVDWRACIDPAGRAVEVRACHLGMAVDPAVIAEVAAALRTPVGRPRLTLTVPAVPDATAAEPLVVPAAG